MATSETRAIIIENDRGGDVGGTLYVRKFSVTDRVLRALVMLGAMWVLAVVTVAIPIAHFVLVPFFLIAGPVFAVMRFRVTEINERVTGACPTCGREVAIALDPSDRLPLWTYCPPAGDPIRLLDADVSGRRIGPGA